jgi:hypothetical protein
MLNLQRVFTLTQKLVPMLLASLPLGNREDGPWVDPGASPSPTYRAPR